MLKPLDEIMLRILLRTKLKQIKGESVFLPNIFSMFPELFNNNDLNIFFLRR